LALAALHLGGCVDQEPIAPAPEPLDAPVDPYGDNEGALSAPTPTKLAFGASSGVAYQAGQTAQWQFDAAKGGQFTIDISTYAKGAPLFVALDRQVGSGWTAVKSAAGVGSVQVGLTPASDGSYRLSVTGGKSKQSIYAKLSCVKGICALPQCPANPSLQAIQALGQLKRAVGTLQSGGQLKGVLYTSESDFPVELKALSGTDKKGPVEPAELLQALGLAPTTAVDLTWNPAKFFAGLQNSGMAPDHVQLLQQALANQASQWRVLRLGKVQVQLWLVGRTACGALIGLRTTLIET
jgi:hypothetical protein